MDSNHRANVVRITEIHQHPNADSLGLVRIGGYQVVVKLGEYSVGDLAVYIQPDSVVPETKQFEWLWADSKEALAGLPIPEKRRRITVRRFRKEYSEGLLVRIPDGNHIDPSATFLSALKEGDDAASLMEISHYDPPEPVEIDGDRVSVKQSKIWPRSLKGWFYFSLYWLSFGLYDPWGSLGGANVRAPKNTPPIYDVESFKNYHETFIPGEKVVVTEKIHGSNARYVYEDGAFGGKMYAGSRKLWKRPGGNSIWLQILKGNPDIEEFCRKHPGYVLYGEVVPAQTSKSGFVYDYGTTTERPHFFLFDIRKPDGEWMEYDDAGRLLVGYCIGHVPELYRGPYDKSIIDGLTDGKTKTPGQHIREGVVVKTVPERHVHGLGRAQLKIVSNKFFEAEGK